MTQITVPSAAGAYDVHTGPGLLTELPEILAAAFPESRFAVLSDTRVAGLYGEALAAAFTRASLSFETFTVPPGEGSKSLSVFASLQSVLASHRFNRADVLVALGGGVVGDLGGFIAATYLRGIRYVQVPTTLLAQIDSAVGGKTAVNLPEGKNLVGAFYPPRAVYADTDTLQTLLPATFADGMAELIKYALIRDADMFARLERAPLTPQSPDLPALIRRCVAIKRDIVAADERDTGERMLLNFGHTIGHGIERLCAAKKQPMTHGRAVAMGMAAITAASERLELTEAGTAQRIRTVLEMAGLPASIDGFDAQEILSGVLVDKKNIGSALNLVLLRKPGEAFLHPIARADMLQYME